MNLQRIPPVTAVLGQACYHCSTPEHNNVAPLKRCTGCRAVHYCDYVCQQANWKEHKGICKALQSIEHDDGTRRMIYISLVTDDSDLVEDPSTLNSMIEFITSIQIRYIEEFLNRSLTIPERNLLGWEPRCIGCARSDRIMRMEAALEPEAIAPKTLKACQACKMTFYCSTNHWSAVQHKHLNEPCEGGHDGLTQCQMNKEICGDLGGLTQCQMNKEICGDLEFLKLGSSEFQWAPPRDLPAWRSLENVSWETEYTADLPNIPAELAGPFLRSASDGLSMPLTILWALEHLDDNLSFSSAHTLIIHILGVSELEIVKASMFEEILHRLPGVQNLKIILCDPRLNQMAEIEERSSEIDMETCPNCQARGRRRVHQLISQTYHDYGTTEGSKFVKPHLAVAFNSGASQESTDFWKATMDFLVKHKIPSVFTAYNREEAVAEAQLLTTAGADLVPTLGPVKNPWGSRLAKLEPNRLIGFYAVNGWLAGGFRDSIDTMQLDL